MSKRKNRSSTPNRSRQMPGPVAMISLAILLVVAGLGVIWTSSGSDAGLAPTGEGAPKLVVEQPVIDEGYQKYSTPIQTAFRLRNDGNQPLKILGEPQVVLAEGC